MDPHISIITLGVENLQRSIRFYRDELGLPVAHEQNEVIFFETTGTWLALRPREELARDAGVSSEGSEFTRFTLTHNVDSTEKVDALFNRAVEAGAEPMKEPKQTDWGGYAGYFADPNGFLWEVAWNPDFEIGED